MRAYRINPSARLIAIALLVASILSLGLAGCASQGSADDITSEAVVLHVDGDSVLLADRATEAAYFPYIPEGGLFAEDGQAITADQLKPGDIVEVIGNGVIAESYPAQYPGITHMQVIGFDDADLAEYDYIVSRVFPAADPSEVPSAYVEYAIEDIGTISVALEAHSYLVETPEGTVSADGAVVTEDGMVLEGVPDMVVSDTNHVMVALTSDIAIEEAQVTCIPTEEVEGEGLIASMDDGYSIAFETDDDTLGFDVDPGYLYNVMIRFDRGEASYSFVVK